MEILNQIEDLTAFEGNQNVQVTVDKNGILSCRSLQATSTPGVIHKNFRFPGPGEYCLEITGWATVPKAFIQVVDPNTKERLVDGYQYMSLKSDTVYVNMELKKNAQVYHLAILFGGKETVQVGDTFYISKVVLSTRSISGQPRALHQQKIVLRMPEDPVEPMFKWKQPELPPISVQEDTKITNQNPFRYKEFGNRLVPRRDNMPVTRRNDTDTSSHINRTDDKETVESIVDLKVHGVRLLLLSNGLVRWERIDP